MLPLPEHLIYLPVLFLWIVRGRLRRDCMVVGFTSAHAVNFN